MREETGRADRKHRRTEIARRGKDQDPHQRGAQHRHESQEGEWQEGSKIKGRKVREKNEKGKRGQVCGGRERARKIN